MLFKILYGAFALVAAAILIFTGPTGRRLFILAMATGGGASFLVRLIYPGLTSAEMTMVQIMVFPFLVLGTWGGLFIAAKLRER